MSSSDIFTTATQLAVLASGRAPVWTTQPDSGSLLPPATGIVGVALEESVRVLAHISLREDAHHRTARLSVSVVDLTCTYSVTINGTTVSYNATTAPAADLDDILEGIAAAIMASGTLNVLVLAEADLDAEEVVVTGLGEADFSINFTESDGATIACVADPCRATARMWWMPTARAGSTPPAVWTSEGAPFTVTRRGLVERFDCGGLDRLFVQLYERVGHSADGSMVTLATPTISIGPCLTEEA